MYKHELSSEAVRLLKISTKDKRPIKMDGEKTVKCGGVVYAKTALFELLGTGYVVRCTNKGADAMRYWVTTKKGREHAAKLPSESVKVSV